MPQCRVYEMPDGTVRVVHPNPGSRQEGEPEADWYARTMARTEAATPDLQGRPFVDLDANTLPLRQRRYAWRLRGGRVQDDPGVPSRPHPRQALIDQARQANSVVELRAVVQRLIEEG